MNDVNFYEDIMGKEEAPFKFKIHLFLNSKNDRRDEQETEKSPPKIRDLNLVVMEKLSKYGAINVNDSVLRDK